MNTIKLFTSPVGQEFIGEVLANNCTPDKTAFKNLMIIKVVQTGQDSFGLQLIPASVADQAGIKLVRNDHMAIESLEVPRDLATSYIKETTGIEIASSFPGI